LLNRETDAARAIRLAHMAAAGAWESAARLLQGIAEQRGHRRSVTVAIFVERCTARAARHRASSKPPARARADA